MRPVAIDQALRDPRLLGAALGSPESWSTWLTAWRAISGQPLDDAQREVFARIAGNRPPPSRPVREAWVVAGRGAGKSRMTAAGAVHAATDAAA